MEASATLARNAVDAVPDVLYALDADCELIWSNHRLSEVTGYTTAELDGLDPFALLPEDDEPIARALVDSVVSEGCCERMESRLVTKSGTELPYEFSGGPVTVDGAVVGLAGVGRDLSERRGRSVARDRETSLLAAVRSVNEALNGAGTRSDVERAACERLADGEAYCGARIWDRRGDPPRYEPRASAGETSALGRSWSADPSAENFVAAAVRTDAVVPRTGGQSGDGRRPEGGGTGDSIGVNGESEKRAESGSIAAVPIADGNRRFAVLGVATERSGAFGTDERAILAELARSIADAVDSALTRQLLYADSVTEVELRVTDPADPLVSLSERVGCRFALEHAVAFDDAFVAYGTIAGATAEEVLDVAADDERFDHAEPLDIDGEGHAFEFRIAGPERSVAGSIAQRGGRVTDATAEDGVATVCAELPPAEDVRDLYEAVDDRFPATDVAAIREVTSSTASVPAFDGRIGEALTEKQRGALEAAFASGYFEWPARASTAEEIAATLGIAPQTFHQHLRIAQRKVLEVLLRDGDASDTPTA